MQIENKCSPYPMYQVNYFHSESLQREFPTSTAFLFVFIWRCTHCNISMMSNNLLPAIGANLLNLQLYVAIGRLLVLSPRHPQYILDEQMKA